MSKTDKKFEELKRVTKLIEILKKLLGDDIKLNDLKYIDDEKEDIYINLKAPDSEVLKINLIKQLKNRQLDIEDLIN